MQTNIEELLSESAETLVNFDLTGNPVHEKFAEMINQIPADSFKNFTNLVRLNLSNFLQLEKIGYDTFRNAWSLQEIHFSYKLKEIKSGSFHNCTSLVTLDFSKCEELEIISFDTFTNSWSLEEIRFPNHVKEIRSGAFHNCTKLVRLDFSNCEELELLGFDSFTNAWSLQEIRFSPNLKEIRSGSFQNCTNLVRLDFSNCYELEKIGYDTFKNNWSLQEIIFPSNLKEILSESFCNCTSLVTLRIPASVIKIQSGVFHGCTQLREVIFEGNTRVDDGAFQNCPNLITQIFPRKIYPGLCYGKYSELKESMKFEKSGRCGITQEGFEEDPEVPDPDIVILPCGHPFREKPLYQWLLRQEICPTCRIIL